ncbi:YoaK family protein [Flavobacterium yafengii]|uniref:YoaK family protein n=1 Tax=Flavobacterium yafengii TaxID=3041253 RepID=UPI0024A7FB56|nr:YoaK family protein [Flavobacterium yafengii]MDI5888671.1 YoaK family protein [Flavobacterium yafengii]
MFRHQGKNRTFIHNLRLATLLSFVAGIVNVTGVLSIQTLTTNVTGHFAYFAEEIMKRDYAAAITFFVFTIFFLLGAFTSNFLAELISKKYPNLSHVIPISLEMIVLIAVGIFGAQSSLSSSEGKWIAFSMLFAMGIQNSLVTKISQSTVRTTHLTGLFTDLGIELSQLFFYKKTDEKKKLKTSIYLRLSIIIFFFIGCISGGFLYNLLEMKTLFVAATFLLFALLYDYIRLQFHVIKRKTFYHKTILDK